MTIRPNWFAGQIESTRCHNNQVRRRNRASSLCFNIDIVWRTVEKFEGAIFHSMTRAAHYIPPPREFSIGMPRAGEVYILFPGLRLMYRGLLPGRVIVVESRTDFKLFMP